MFDGERIQDDQTALDLDMQEGDTIEVLLERGFVDDGVADVRGRWLVDCSDESSLFTSDLLTIAPRSIVVHRSFMLNDRC